MKKNQEKTLKKYSFFYLKDPDPGEGYKNGKYYHVSVENVNYNGNTESGTEDDVVYIEEIISTLQ